LLLDLHARPDGFVAGDAFGSLAARLSAAGHAVRHARLVAADFAGAADSGGQKGFFEAIAREVEASGAEVVVLARAWERGLAEAARGAQGREAVTTADLGATAGATGARPGSSGVSGLLQDKGAAAGTTGERLAPGGRTGRILVRLTNGVRAAIDDAFDHVLDPAGLLALLAGDPSPPAAEYQRTTAADLRRRLAMAGDGPGAGTVYTTTGDAYTTPAGAPETEGHAYTTPNRAYTRPEPASPGVRGPIPTQGRPTISGPSSGCPFLLDARQSPAFAGVALDPERIQTKGCSFCLDNSGAYVVPKAGEVVAAWLDGLRRIRAARGDGSEHASPGGGGSARPPLLEVLLTDERPHPHLPAFFEAIAAVAGLAPVELLWKSRADWLLEYASDVERACAIAERSGSVVHLYLVGFESFDRGHLDLFNKGHGPELNEAAIAKMRELQGRFPRSFEHRRHRSHGIVLFTPWTEPEALLTNAAWMRRLRFHELRSEAVKTRLRLYPRVPLHQKAQEDGLLAERFEEGRGDRAAEQGYDASVPWRFRDPRTEAIFQLANALHEIDRSIPDADVLEVATRFVVRWPGLASAPSLAHLPVRAAVEAWGAPLAFLIERLGPAAAAFDPEIEAIGATGKIASLKESVRGADAEDMARAYRAMGLAAEVVLRHTMERTSGAHASGADHAVICVARDEEALTKVLAAQRSLAASRGDENRAAVRERGVHMGYPECCVAAFAALPDRGDNLANERAPFLRSPDAPLHPLLHRTGAVRLLAHHLCSPACAASIAFAERVVEGLRAADPEAPARLLSLLRTPSLFLDYGRFAAIEGAFHGPRFAIEAVLRTGRATAFEALLASAAAAELTPNTVTLGFADGTDRTLPAAHPLLLVPGAPIAPAALAAITPSPHTSSVNAPSTHATATRTPAPPHAPPGTHALPLPSALRPGVRVAAYTIASIDRTEAGHTVWLAGRGDRFAVHLRAHTEGTPYTLRRGRWAIDLDDPATLGDPARAALGLLIRALA
jgi:hypothetical protein